MSYASGLMLGAAFGRQIHDYFSFKKQRAMQPAAPKNQIRNLPFFAKVFQIDGRRRYRSALLLGNERLARLLLERMGHLRHVEKVEVNIYTGSVLIFFHPCNAAHAASIENHLRRLILGSSAIPGDISRDMLVGGTAKLYEMANYLNNYIREKSNNYLDLNILVSILFIMRGVRKILLYGERISGPQLLWWAFSLLRGWRMV